MEPFSALAVATAVVQFLDFLQNVFSAVRNIHHGNVGGPQIWATAKELSALNDEIRKTVQHPNKQPFSSQDRQIGRLGERCTELGDRLMSALDRIQCPSKNKLWASYREALRTVWRQNEIDSLQRDLECYQRQIFMYILISLREHITITDEAQSQHTSRVEHTLSETRDLCNTTLVELSKKVSCSWQNNLVRAINDSYGLGFSKQEARAPPAKLHEVLATRDLRQIEQVILLHLQFGDMNKRYEQIPVAHQATFEWLYRPPPSSASWSNFVQWIEGDAPLYWITGKAGAGKSTLMRFINNHARTQQALQVWAASDPLIRASFFFWNSGTPIQMSTEGLVRTLLYQLLEQLPHLISVVLPHRVEMLLLLGNFDFEESSWNWEELLKAFRSFIKTATETNRIVFFIDGMDEFNGQSSDIIEFVTSLVAPRVKVCVSSRPWIAFEDAFSTLPRLRLEHLTFDDISHYVTSKLVASPGFRTLQQLDQTFSSRLIENVCQKSSGVFLWVSLVTRSLIDGVSEGEKLYELQSRLDSLPADLENLFSKIIGSLEPTQLEKASQLFQTFRASLRTTDLLDLSFADEDNPDMALNILYDKCLTDQQIESRAEQMRRRINACCKGLLDITTHDSSPMQNRTVNYLHRTVKDYLERADIWTDLCRVTTEGFNPNLRLSCSQLSRLKTTRLDLHVDKFLGRVTLGIEYAVRADPGCETHQVSLLNAFGHELLSLPKYYDQNQHKLFIDWAQKGFGLPYPYTFLEFTVRCGLVNFVETTLNAVPQSKMEVSKLLHFAVSGTVSAIDVVHLPALNPKDFPSQALLKVLLERGADPNFKPRSKPQQTSWECTLADDRISEEVMKEFLLHRADPRQEGLQDHELVRSDGDLQKLIKKVKRKTRWSHYTPKFRRRTP